MLSPGDEVLVEHPGYEPLTRAAEGLGAVVRTFERRAEEGFRVVPERVAAAVTPRTRVIVVTNLHNPSGVRTPDATLRELAQIAEARGAYLLVDEVYAPFDELPEDGVFRTSARKLAPNVVAVSSLTKCYGLGMHRIGWVLGPSEIVERAEAAMIATCGHLPLVARGARRGRRRERRQAREARQGHPRRQARHRGAVGGDGPERDVERADVGALRPRHARRCRRTSSRASSRGRPSTASSWARARSSACRTASDCRGRRSRRSDSKQASRSSSTLLR